MAMTKREKQRITAQENTLIGLGFTAIQADKLRKISMTLQRWHELECGIDGGCIERNEKTDKPYWRSEYSGKLSRIPDREKGAKKRYLAKEIDKEEWMRIHRKYALMTEAVQQVFRKAM